MPDGSDLCLPGENCRGWIEGPEDVTDASGCLGEPGWQRRGLLGYLASVDCPSSGGTLGTRSLAVNASGSTDSHAVWVQSSSAAGPASRQ
jgi:hypothetical protein